jgi:SAM-dependent methyltransferase
MNPSEFQNIALAEEEMWWFRGMRRILDAWVGRLGGARFGAVLEAGCGTGYMSAWMARRWGWTVFPVDLDFGGLSYARRDGVPRLTQADIAQLPFKDSRFDAVVSLDVLVHFERGAEVAALEEFARLLRPRGKLILRVSALDLLRSRHSEFVHEKQRFTAERLRESLAAGGFRVMEMSYANALLVPVALLKFRVWEELTGAEASSGVETPAGWMNWLLELPLRWEARWLRWGKGFPLGQSLLVLAEKQS